MNASFNDKNLDNALDIPEQEYNEIMDLIRDWASSQRWRKGIKRDGTAWDVGDFSFQIKIAQTEYLDAFTVVGRMDDEEL
jgi:hypothetical protein